MSTLDKSMEIRKLQAKHLRPLVEILDSNDSWKTLMAKIPKKLSSNGYKCGISIDNLAKYRAQDFSKIDQGSIDYKRSPTEILIDEWGTSGRPRAALGHLFYLLIKAELFRAADYIAQIIGEKPPPRPTTGAAARVTFNIPELDPETVEAERQLNEINYLPKAIEEIKKMSEHASSPARVIPEIVVSKDESSEDHMSSGLDSSAISGNIPDFSGLLDNVQDSPEDADILPISNDVPALSIFDSEQIDIIPNFDMLQSNEISSGELETIGSSASFDAEIPLVLPELEQSNDSYNTDIPLFLKSSEISSCELQTIQSSEISYNSEIPLIVPQLLENTTSPLTLNTKVPHFAYKDLEKATSNFTSQILGEGGFGSVFLATGLTDKPVAVKKLILDTGSDKVAKQFRNEVEVMHKYKHDNLALLLGYSCDVIYCLVYEYIPGGNLREALQNRTSLAWKTRLQVALGTAKAVEYLHNAFSTPLIHRDVTSSNILLDGQKKAKLCDFGIAKLLPEQPMDLDTVPCGTSVYMSPEYRLKDVSVYLDTFSFGVVLLELLTSLSPFDADGSGTDLISHMEEMCEQSIDPILDKKIGSWEENNVNYADKLYGLVQRCLDEKNNRPDMKTVVNELQMLVDSLIVPYSVINFILKV